MGTVDLTTTATISASEDVVVYIYEDVSGDGTIDNRDAISISNGTNTVTSADVFDGSGNFAVNIAPSTTDITTTASVTSADVAAAPSAPSNLSVVQGVENQLDLTWTDNASTEDGFHVWRDTVTGSTTGDYTQVADLAADTTSYTDTGLNDGEQYYYRVTAYNTSGDSSVSNEDSAITVLPAPSSLSVTVDTQNYDEVGDLSWVNNHDNGSIDVLRATSSGSVKSDYTAVTNLPFGTGSYTDSGVSEDTTYYWRVAATTEHTDSLSGEVSVFTDLVGSVGETTSSGVRKTTASGVGRTDESK